MRVLHLITSLERGGAQGQLELLVLGARAYGVESTVVVLVPGGAHAQSLAQSGFALHDLGLSSGQADPRALLRLARLIGRLRPELLSTWLYHADLLGTLVARWTHVPRLVWNLRCTPLEEGAHGWAARAAPRLCARLSSRPDAIVANAASARASHERLGYRARRWEVVPNGIDARRFRPRPEERARLHAELDLAPGTTLVGSLARDHAMKDHAGLLDAFARARAAEPHLALVLAGAGTERFAGRPAVHALGERADPERLLAGLDAFVLASSSGEGFPNALGEAMAAGLPCVATDVGDARALLGDAGCVVARRDPATLASALIELAHLAPALRERRAERARARILEHFTVGRCVERHVALWTELVEARPCVA
jgi:glycosyltransferase involved in cell wall biosynthesis